MYRFAWRRPMLITVQFTYYRDYGSAGYYDLEFSEEEDLAYLHPFGCECRAYARLQELGVESAVAVPCFGYLFIDGVNLQKLRSKDTFDWSEDWGYSAECEGQPLCALVKEYIELPSPRDVTPAELTEVNVTPKTISTFIRTVKTIHRSGILIQDINSENVFHGKISEFSRAWTMPHPCLIPRILDDTFFERRFRDACMLYNNFLWTITS